MVILGLNSLKQLNINSTTQNYNGENDFEFIKFVVPQKTENYNADELNFTLNIYDLSNGVVDISENIIERLSINPDDTIKLSEKLTAYNKLGFTVEISTASQAFGKTNLVALRITNNLDLNDSQSDSGSTGGGGSDIDTSNFATKADLEKVNQRIDEIEISIPEISAEQTGTGGTVTVGDEQIVLTNGADGADGFSPIVSVSEIENGHQVNITDVNGLKQFEVLNGQNGADGQNGSDYILTEQDKQEIAEFVDVSGEATEKWELINTVVIDKEVNGLKITEDSLGNPFKLKKVRIAWKMKPCAEQTVTNSLAIDFNSDCPNVWGSYACKVGSSPIKTDTCQNLILVGEFIGGYFSLLECRVSQNRTNVTQLLNVSSGQLYYPERFQKGDAMVIGSYLKCIGIGSTFSIWGVRDSE